MRVLFVSGCNDSIKGRNPVVNGVGEGLTRLGVDVDYFVFSGKGWKKYFFGFFELRKFLKGKKYDLLHGHFSLSAIVASLCTSRPVVCSLLGSDMIRSGALMTRLIRFFIKNVWQATIVKSAGMLSMAKGNVYLIPNGIDLSKAVIMDRQVARKLLGLGEGKHLVFIAVNPELPVKNLSLAKKAVALIKEEQITLHVISNSPHATIIQYINAADAVITTSLSEGSPNVVKEALACNVPIVATNVGDIAERIEGVAGCYLTTFEPGDVAGKIREALVFNGRTKGREKVNEINQEVISQKIVALYGQVLKEGR